MAFDDFQIGIEGGTINGGGRLADAPADSFGYSAAKEDSANSKACLGGAAADDFIKRKIAFGGEDSAIDF